MPLARRVKLGLVSVFRKLGICFVMVLLVTVYSCGFQRYICIFSGHICQNDQAWSAALFYMTSEFVNALSVFSISKRYSSHQFPIGLYIL
jgi:hypothetical protein